MFILGLITLSILVAFLVMKYVLKDNIKKIKNEAVDEIKEEYFSEKDLPIKEQIQITKDLDIKLYDLKYEDESNQVFDETNLTYSKLARMINKNIEWDFVDSNDGENFDVDVKLTDFKLEENEFLYMEIIEMVTSFNLAQFVFRNKKGEIDFKLFHLDNEILEKMKEHTDEIIHKVFLHVVNLIVEKEETGELEKAFANKFL